MEEMLKIVGRMDPEKALEEIAGVLKVLFSDGIWILENDRAQAVLQ